MARFGVFSHPICQSNCPSIQKSNKYLSYLTNIMKERAIDGQDTIFYTKYVVNLHFPSSLEFVSFMPIDGLVTFPSRSFIWEGLTTLLQVFLVSIKHFRKFIFPKLLVPKAHACAIESIFVLLISTIMANRGMSRTSSPALPTFYHLSGMIARMI